MENISFEEIGSVVATFPVESSVQNGYAVGIKGRGSVGVTADGGPVCGVALEANLDGLAGVQVGGFVTVAYSGSGITPGWTALVSDGSGGIRKANSGEAGHEFLVVRTDAAARTAVVLL